MSDIRNYIQIVVESMKSYEHVDVDFRGERFPVEVIMYGGEMVDWSFAGMGAEQHAALRMTPEETEEVESQIADELAPVW